MEPVTVNFAMTRDDYMSGQLARAKSGTARTETIAVKIFGIFLILLAFLLLLTRTTQKLAERRSHGRRNFSAVPVQTASARNCPPKSSG